MLTVIVTVTFSQSNWLYFYIGDDISILLPHKPTHKVNDNSEMFIAKTDNNVLMTLIQANAVPVNQQFENFNETKREELISIFLANAIKGAVKDNPLIVSPETIYLKNYQGRQFSYRAVNPVTGKVGERYVKMFVVRNNLYTIMSWCLNTSNDAVNERNKFMNSITIK